MGSPDQYRGIYCVEDMIVSDRLLATVIAHNLSARAREVRSTIQPMTDKEITSTTIAVVALGPLGIVHPAWGRQVGNMIQEVRANLLDRRSAAIMPRRTNYNALLFWAKSGTISESK